jgi:hypothetical protein
MSYRIAGIDVHKRMLAVVMSDVEVDGEYHFDRRTVGTSPDQLRSLAEWLVEHEVEEVVMESTAQYWRPVWGDTRVRSGLSRCTGRRTGVRQEKYGRIPVVGRADGTDVGPLRGRHYGTIAATMSTGAQIRWRIMRLITHGQIGNVRLRGLVQANDRWLLLIHHSLAGRT